MNLTSIVTLLQLVLTLLSNPTTANNPAIQSLAQQAISDATQALSVQTITTTTTSTTVPTTTPVVGVYILPTPTTPTTTLTYDGMTYPYTSTNAALINQINTENASCTAAIASLQAYDPHAVQAGLTGTGSITNPTNENPAIKAADIASEQNTCDNQITIWLDGLYKGN